MYMYAGLSEFRRIGIGETDGVSRSCQRVIDRNRIAVFDTGDNSLKNIRAQPGGQRENRENREPNFCFHSRSPLNLEYIPPHRDFHLF